MISKKWSNNATQGPIKAETNKYKISMRKEKVNLRKYLNKIEIKEAIQIIGEMKSYFFEKNKRNWKKKKIQSCSIKPALP